MKILVSDVVFRKELYPRIDTNHLTVQQYAEVLPDLPPITINQKFELIDGWHRLMAHKKKEVEEIEVNMVETTGDAELHQMAIEANAKHGLQFTQAEKENAVRSISAATPMELEEKKRKHLKRTLTARYRTVFEWNSSLDKDKRNVSACIILMENSPSYAWTAKTQESEDAEDLGNKSLDDFAKKLAKNINNLADSVTDTYLALVLQPTQWHASDREFADHVGDIVRAVTLPVEMQFSVVIESQRCKTPFEKWLIENNLGVASDDEVHAFIVWKVLKKT